MLHVLRRLFRKPAWSPGGSLSYQVAVVKLANHAATAARRKAWGGKRAIFLRDPSHDLCSSRIRESMPRDFSIYPPGYHVIHVIDQGIEIGMPGTLRRDEWWVAPTEEIDADDWQYREHGFLPWKNIISDQLPQ